MTREIVIEQWPESFEQWPESFEWRQEVRVDDRTVYFVLEPMPFRDWGPHLQHIALREWLRRAEP